MHRSAAVFLLLLVAGCEQSKPRYRSYVPGPSFREEMLAGVLGTPADSVAAGEWVTLHAARTAGPWVLSDSAGEANAPCRRVSPVEREFEVASKVKWRIQPSEGIAFNIPGPPDFVRQVKFTRPGRYEVWAVSEGCAGPFESNRFVVEVR